MGMTNRERYEAQMAEKAKAREAEQAKQTEAAAKAKADAAQAEAERIAREAAKDKELQELRAQLEQLTAPA